MCAIVWVAAQQEVGGAPIQLRTIQVCSKDLASALGSTATCSYDPLSAENAAVARLDVLSLCLHRLWIAFYQLDGGERPAPCLLLDEPWNEHMP